MFRSCTRAGPDRYRRANDAIPDSSISRAMASHSPRKRCRLRGTGAVAGAQDDQRADARGVLHRQVQPGEAAHGDADDVRRLGAESVQDRDGVVDRVLLRVGAGIGRHP